MESSTKGGGMEIGYSQSGQATVRYAVIEKLPDGRYKVKRITDVLRPNGSKYFAFGELEIVSDLKITEEGF